MSSHEQLKNYQENETPHTKLAPKDFNSELKKYNKRYKKINKK